MTRDDYVKVIKDAFVTVGTKAAMAALVSAAPEVFALPIVNYITSHLINYILGILADAAEMQAFFVYIDLRTSKQGQDFFEAATKNRDVQRTGTAKEKADAEADLINKFRALAKLTN